MRAGGDRRPAGRRRTDLPLDGILVADFSRVLAGPLCTQMLGDFGARVIKIEEPGQGDETRRWGPPFANGVSTYFLSINRNKESLGLDLKRGREVVTRLIERADVVIDNFLPSQRASLGMDRVREQNPRAIHCVITGFDPDTPEAMRPGYDLLAQAGSGLMSITGPADGDPVKEGVAIVDILAAHYAFGAITAALFARERAGHGTAIAVSLFGTAVASLINVAQSALITGSEAKRHGNEHASIVPYQLFHASDRPFVIGAGTDRHFRALCESVIGRPELASASRFASNQMRVRNRKRLIPLLESIFRAQPAADWIRLCRAAEVPAELVRGVREALRSEGATPLVVSLRHAKAGVYDAVRTPPLIDGQRLPAGSPPPQLGEHTDRILRELGFEPRAITEMRRDGIIGPRTTSGRAPRRR